MLRVYITALTLLIGISANAQVFDLKGQSTKEGTLIVTAKAIEAKSVRLDCRNSVMEVDVETPIAGVFKFRFDDENACNKFSTALASSRWQALYTHFNLLSQHMTYVTEAAGKVVSSPYLLTNETRYPLN